jgi:hypothetical protein
MLKPRRGGKQARWLEAAACSTSVKRRWIDLCIQNENLAELLLVYAPGDEGAVSGLERSHEQARAA